MAIGNVQLAMGNACHIRTRWSHTKDESMQNGIAFIPTIHCVFDLGIVKISPEYHIIK